MRSQSTERNQLFGELATEWNLLDQVRVNELLQQLSESDGCSIETLAIEQSLMSETDCAAISWMIDQRLRQDSQATPEQSLEFAQKYSPKNPNQRTLN